MTVQTREIVCTVRAIPANTVSGVPAELIYTDGNAAGESNGSRWAGTFSHLRNTLAAAHTRFKTIGNSHSRNNAGGKRK